EDAISQRTIQICERVGKFIESSINIFNDGTKIDHLHDEPKEKTNKRSSLELKEKAENSIFQDAISRCSKALDLIRRKYRDRSAEIQFIKLLSDLRDDIERSTK